MSLTLEHKFTREIEPDNLSLLTGREYCEVIEIAVEVEYDGDELLEDLKSVQVFIADQDVTSDLTRKDFAYISKLISEEITDRAHDIVAQLEEPYEALIARAD